MADANAAADDGCTHPVQMAGMCAVCGKVLDIDGESENTFSMMHAHAGIKVSEEEAWRLHSETIEHLLSQRKLALIVDLDQTIIHATVDPTVGEWMKDENNPNWKALKDVGKFKLGIDGKAVASDPSSSSDDSLANGCWYYVKPRPGLPAFLKSLSERYELHVYTMGTRSYADSVCKLVDPDASIFGNRILSRDENGSLVQKSLSRLFPVDTSMVVIIDDRADVWKWSPNLVKVQPYDFFVGIGDINATFLPPVSGAVPGLTETPAAGASPSPSAPDTSASASPPSAGDASSTAITAPSTSGGSASTSDSASLTSDQASGAQTNDDKQTDPAAKEQQEAAALLAVQSQNLQHALDEQRQARPLAKMQEALDEKLEAEAGLSSPQSNGNLDSEAKASSSRTNGISADDAGAASANEATAAVQAGTQASSDKQEADNNKENPAATATSEVDHSRAHNSHAVLRDDDAELDRIQQILDHVHAKWYEHFDRVQKEAGAEAAKKATVSSQPDAAKPTVMEIIADLKRQVLRGCGLVFSSLFPMEHTPETSDIWRVAEEYGAKCYRDFQDGVTHVVAAMPGTVKVNRGHRRPSISVVWPGWLYDSIAKWARQPENWYALPVPADAAKLDDAALAEEEAKEKEKERAAASAAAAASTTAPAGADSKPEPGAESEYEGGAGDGDFAEMDWAEAADEVDAFLDGDDTEEETEDDYDEYPSTPSKRDKIKRHRSSSVESGDGDEDDEGVSDKELLLKSPLSKRRKMAEERAGQSKLKQSITSDDVAGVKALVAGDESATETGSIDESFLDDLANEMELQMDDDAGS